MDNRKTEQTALRPKRPKGKSLFKSKPGHLLCNVMFVHDCTADLYRLLRVGKRLKGTEGSDTVMGDAATAGMYQYFNSLCLLLVTYLQA